MYEYKTEILDTDIKWFTDKATAKDANELDEFLNKRAQEGWELATYSFMDTHVHLRCGTLITFKRVV